MKRGSRGIAQAERSSSLAATSPACAPRPTFWFLSGVVFLYALLVLAGCYAATRSIEQKVSGEVLKRAEAEGSVRVVVELNVGPQGIRAAQDELLHELEGTRHRVTRRYEQIPFLALEVSPAALQVLDTSSTVVRIQEDRLLLPQEGKSP
jgi:hypothetical protein